MGSARSPALFARNVTVDFVHPQADLSRYRVVVAPHLYLVSDETVSSLTRWVAGGGTLLTTFFSGIVDTLDRVRPGAYPGAFRDLLGLHIEEFVPLVPGQTNVVETGDGRAFHVDQWSDVIEIERAEVVARFRDDFLAGGPAVTVHHLERGAAYYSGANLDPDGLAWLVDLILRDAGVSGADAVARGSVGNGGRLEVVERRDESNRWLFVLNHGATPAELNLDVPAVDAIRGTRFEQAARIEPMDLVILRSSR